MNLGELKKIIERINNGLATDEELGLYNAYMNRIAKTETDWSAINGSDFVQNQLWYKIDSAITTKPIQPVQIWRRLGIAATILIALSTGFYFLTYNSQNQRAPNKQHVQKHDIEPGGTKAYLTLANGKRIVLNNAPNGSLAIEANAVINKTANGQITYNLKNGNTSNAPLAFNTISTPKGGTYMIVLSDGSKVWLNAVSSIKYPVEFVGNERKVEITGEVYLEVAHNARKPFKVVANGQTVQVLGTHFNINAYPEEGPISTTLLQGKIKAYNDITSVIINPGQQSRLINNHFNVVNDVDLAQIIAWKEGFFRIKNCDVQTVMRQMARWYDVDVVYEGKIPDVRFTGEIKRNVNASVVLHMLNYFNVHCEIQGDKIIVRSEKKTKHKL